jgi:hypothetical protein
MIVLASASVRDDDPNRWRARLGDAPVTTTSLLARNLIDQAQVRGTPAEDLLVVVVRLAASAAQDART